ncbi:conserved hypothetical protein [Talaromyces stipitatus ATCC 10500]|uniref:Zn(2)-C6 fungal-type domain-containing protein n=1 Tax=Talaromyces stipitatus (strain ATCC 10500 / CBS 375.48 / QM 6759 / NRRL 1006) TaxID=441959 RepID=B8MIF5_TALSN|nr:uncharacterized protein TSTA_041170 [Talaromyces stipitatus ATCC 10500]EED14639.1 conserved hypothetical protein [Talaromyces stipitatus ATCC 10500]
MQDPLDKFETYRYRKSKSGCLTCKPICLRCSSTGRKCDGYRPRKDYAVLVPAFSPPKAPYAENDRETRCFQFFYERTVPALAGYCGSEFWSRLVLQASQHEKAIWHALIALGSLHEDFENNDHFFELDLFLQQQNDFAICEYLAAIRALLGPSTSSSENVTVDVCLISCILFTCFEIISGHYGSAINHIQSGVKILKEVYHDPSSGTFRHPHLRPSTVSSLEMESLRKMFFRLQGQALTLTRADTYHLTQEELAIPDTSLFWHDIPDIFLSIAEARDSFELLNQRCVNHYRIVMQSVSDTMAPEMSKYLLQQYGTCLDKWCTALARFAERRSDSLTSKERIGLKLLNIHKHNLLMYYEYVTVCEMGRYSDAIPPFSWDKFNSQFAEIVSLAASIVTSSVTDAHAESSVKPAFSLDNGVIAPLYEVATLCRDPITRRKAVEVLRSAPRQEGVFNSYLSAMVAEKIIEIEEAAALDCVTDYSSDFPLESVLSGQNLAQHVNQVRDSSEIPDAVRLSYAHPKFDVVKKKVFLTIGQAAKMHMDIPWSDMNYLVDSER